MTSIFAGQPLKTRPFRIKTRVIWVPGILFKFHLQQTLINIEGLKSTIYCIFLREKKVPNLAGKEHYWRNTHA